MEKVGPVDQKVHRYAGNPADRPLTTFDTNIVIALRNNEADAQRVRQLLALHLAGVITVNVTLSMAFEEQLDGHEYEPWLQEQGIAPENIFTVPHTVSFSIQGTPATFIFDTQLERELSERIHRILFPEVPFTWMKYRDQECARRGIVDTKYQALLELDARLSIPSSSQSSARLPLPALDALEQREQEEVYQLYGKLSQRWTNAKNDALGFYSHLSHAMHTTHPERAVFVTNDRDFLRRTKVADLRKLGFAGEILRPAEAVVFLRNVTGTTLPDL